MKKPSLLIVSLLMLILAAGLLIFGVSYTNAPIQQQQEITARAFSLTPFVFFGAMLAGFLLWISALIHMLTNPGIQGTDKIVWVLVIIFLNVLGAILYFCLSPSGRSQSPTPG